MQSRLFTALALVVAASSACSGAPPAPPEKPSPVATATPPASAKPSAPPIGKASPPALRLPRSVAPTKASVALTVVPSEETTKGSIDIDVTVNESTRIVWLNGAGITVDLAGFEHDGAKYAAQVALGGEDFIGLTFSDALPTGQGRLHLDFRGKIDGAADRGLFRQDEDGSKYVYTQFENIEARRAFPCFDEPQYKIPWQLTLRVKQSDNAFSNTPVVSEGKEGELKVIRFAETKPLPSYLVAFAVGPFDVTSAGNAGRNNVALRVITPKGQSSQAGFAVSSTGKLLALLEDYFDIAYPYEKMDVVAIPRLATFGAMENAGMITIASRLALIPGGKETPFFQRRYVSVMAHELAHQWFGDLVTMSWWNDIWLNEGFASWMGDTIATRARPDLRLDFDRVRSASWAMGEDSLLSARKIRQEIETKDDIQNAFDGITYTKGANVIRMFEDWVGAEPFRKGIQRYLKARSWGNATSADFLGDVSDGSGKDMRAAFATFLDRPGVPLVRAALTCEKNKAKLSLAQERYLPVGSKGDAAADPWQIPVCARYGDAKSSSRVCSLLTDRKAEIDLPGSSCPSWIVLKDGGSGYYRAAYAEADFARLFDEKKAPLTLLERLSLIEDMKALIHNGKLSVGDAFGRLPALVKSGDPEIIRSALSLVGSVPEAHVPDALRPKLAAFITSTFGPKAKALGWKGKPSDSVEERRLRMDLVPFVAVRGEEKSLLDEAKKLALKWIDDPTSLEDDAVEGVLQAAAAHGDRALFDRMRAEARKTKDSRRSEHLRAGLSSFLDPALARASLDLVLSDEFAILDSVWIMFQSPRNAPVVLAFLKNKIDAVVEKLPIELRSEVIETVFGVCDERGRSEVESLFKKERTASIVGGPRKVTQVEEAIDLCIAEDAIMRPALKTFLEKK